MDTRPSTARPTRSGPVFTNPATGERAVLLADPATRADRAMVAHLHVAVGGRVAAPHSHPFATERFHVMTGRVAFLIGGRERVLVPGEQAEVPPGTVHDWWQVGDTAAEVIVDMAPGDRFVDMLSTIFGLVGDGQVDRRGLPHLLQLAVTARHYRDAMVFTSPPPWLQTVMFAVLSPIGRLLGRRPAYPRYRHPDESAELDPRALALLDEHGRLRWNS